MLSLSLLLVPMVLAAEGDRTINNYMVTINDHTLKSVQPTEKSSSALDLSGLGLQYLDKDAFAGLATLRNLSLANNSLSSIPNELFSRLSSLEHLQLADNDISHFNNTFVNLSNLRTLDISNNRLKGLREGELHGLPSSSVVYTKGLPLVSINTCVFQKPDKDHYDPWSRFRDDDQTANKTDDNNLDIKICMRDDVLTLVEPFGTNETLPSGCRLVRTTSKGRILSLASLGISKFAGGWCRLQSTSINQLSLAKNNIARFTRETLNALPENIHHVDLNYNRIERIEKGIIENGHLRTLRMTRNGLTEIEDDAFARTSLRELYFYENLLQDTTFIRTLPSTLVRLTLKDNKIADILPGSFANLGRLNQLGLDNNRIQELRTDTLQGLTNLTTLRLFGNEISRVPVGFFRHSPNLAAVSLSHNRIASFERGVFDDVPKLTELEVIHNRLTSIKNTFPAGLPAKLKVLSLDKNKIEVLQNADFVHASLGFLSFNGNKISRIEPGAFHLPKLMFLGLGNNSLQALDPDSFLGLNVMRTLELDSNGIKNVPRHFAKHMRGLVTLSLRGNHIKRLQNGALYGFKKNPDNTIQLTDASVDAIEGGLFDM